MIYLWFIGIIVFLVLILVLAWKNLTGDIKKLEDENEGKEGQALKVESEIIKKKEYLTEYTNAKNAELESLQRSLKTSDDFYKKLYNVLEKIAEGGGYSMILSLQESNAILWYSNSVDITSQVISELGL